jgi:hypothetical protein
VTRIEVVLDPGFTTVAVKRDGVVEYGPVGRQVAVYANMPLESEGGVNVTSSAAVGQSPLYAVIATSVGGSGTIGTGGTGFVSANSVTTPVGVPEFQVPCSKVEDADPESSFWTRFVAAFLVVFITVPVTTALPGSTERIWHTPPGCTCNMFVHTNDLSA